MYSPSDLSAVSTIHEVPSPDLVSRILCLLHWNADELAACDAESHQGPRRKVQSWQIVVGLVAHCLPFAGRFSQCMRRHFGMSLSDSALSQRRTQLGPGIFNIIMQETLRPLAQRWRQPVPRASA